MGCGKGPPAEHRSTLSSPLNPPPLREAAERGHPRPSLLDQCPSRSCLWDFSAFCCVTLYTPLFLGSLLRRGLCTSALAVVLRTGNILLLRDWQIIPYRRIWDAVPYLLPERGLSQLSDSRERSFPYLLLRNALGWLDFLMEWLGETTFSLSIPTDFHWRVEGTYGTETGKLHSSGLST